MTLVVATDGDPRACELCVANADRNGVGEAVRARRLIWSERKMVRDTLSLFAVGRGPQMLIAADVVYGQCQYELEGTVRGIVALSCCGWVVFS